MLPTKDWPGDAALVKAFNNPTPAPSWIEREFIGWDMGAGESRTAWLTTPRPQPFNTGRIDLEELEPGVWGRRG